MHHLSALLLLFIFGLDSNTIVFWLHNNYFFPFAQNSVFLDSSEILWSPKSFAQYSGPLLFAEHRNWAKSAYNWQTLKCIGQKKKEACFKCDAHGCHKQEYHACISSDGFLWCREKWLTCSISDKGVRAFKAIITETFVAKHDSKASIPKWLEHCHMSICIDQVSFVILV